MSYKRGGNIVIGRVLEGYLSVFGCIVDVLLGRGKV